MRRPANARPPVQTNVVRGTVRNPAPGGDMDRPLIVVAGGIQQATYVGSIPLQRGQVVDVQIPDFPGAPWRILNVASGLGEGVVFEGNLVLTRSGNASVPGIERSHATWHHSGEWIATTSNDDDARPAVYSFDGTVLGSIIEHSNELQVISDFHPTQDVIAVASISSTGRVEVRSFNPETGAVGAVVDSVSPGSFRDARVMRWSPDGNFLAVGMNSDFGSGLYVYPWDGSNLGSVINPATGIETVRGLAWHPSQMYLAAGHRDHGNGFTVYEFNGAALSNPQSPSVAIDARGMEFHPHGEHLAVARNESPFVHVYPFDGSLGAPASPSLIEADNGVGRDVGWSKAGGYLYLGGALMDKESPGPGSGLHGYAYEWDGSQFGARILPSPAHGIVGANLEIARVSWSADNAFVAFHTDVIGGDLLEVYTTGLVVPESETQVTPTTPIPHPEVTQRSTANSHPASAIGYSPDDGGDWPDGEPETVAEALDDLAGREGGGGNGGGDGGVWEFIGEVETTANGQSLLIENIPNDFHTMWLVFSYGASQNSTFARYHFNGDDDDNEENYQIARQSWDNTTGEDRRERMGGEVGTFNLSNGEGVRGHILIIDPDSATNAVGIATSMQRVGGTSWAGSAATTEWQNTAKVTSIELAANLGQIASGSYMRLYGLRD